MLDLHHGRDAMHPGATTHCFLARTFHRSSSWTRAALLGAVIAALAAACSDSGGSGEKPNPKAAPLHLLDMASRQLQATPVIGWMAAAADLDRNGRVDLIQPCDDRIRVYNQATAGKFDLAAADFLPKIPAGKAIQVLPGDFNGDGSQDLFVLVTGKGVNHLFVQQSGKFQEGTVVPGKEGDFLHAVSADVDGDKDQDVVVVRKAAESAPAVQMLINDGKGKFSDETAARLPATFQALGAALGDVDGDRTVDLFLSGDGESRLYLNDGKGMFRDAAPDAIPKLVDPKGRIPALGDLDGDGALDVFLASAKASIALLNDGTGRFIDETPFVLGANPGSSSVATLVDLDRDGRLDAAVASASGSFQILRNDGTGRLFDYSSSVVPTSPQPSDTVSAAAADVDGDGDQDLFVSRNNFARPWLLINWNPKPVVDGDGDGMPDEYDVCPKKADPAQANEDAYHFSCSSGTACKAATGCRLALRDTRAYLICTEAKAQAAARAFCKARGADLVVIEDAAENTFLTSLEPGEMYIGASDAETEGTWKWVSGAAVSYKNWNDTEPNNAGEGEHCAVMIGTAEAGGKWNDLPCSAEKGFICEDALVRTTTDPGDACDVCPSVIDADQKDTDKDGKGDACDTKEP